MTDNEIVEALKKCPCRYPDPSCALEKQFDCIRLLHGKVLDLLSRQAKEIGG